MSEINRQELEGQTNTNSSSPFPVLRMRKKDGIVDGDKIEKAGTYYLMVRTEDKDADGRYIYNKQVLGDSVQGVILITNRCTLTGDDGNVYSYEAFQQWFDNKQVFTIKSNQDTSFAFTGTVQEIKDSFPDMKIRREQVLYMYLVGIGETVRFKVSGKSFFIDKQSTEGLTAYLSRRNNEISIRHVLTELGSHSVSYEFQKQKFKTTASTFREVEELDRVLKDEMDNEQATVYNMLVEYDNTLARKLSNDSGTTHQSTPSQNTQEDDFVSNLMDNEQATVYNMLVEYDNTSPKKLNNGSRTTHQSTPSQNTQEDDFVSDLEDEIIID